MNESTNTFFDEMAEDFFAECDELLSVIKSDLLKIDKAGEKEKPQKVTLEELLRSCHTLKGLAGMIGAEGLMNLVHGIENYIKSVNEKNLPIGSSKLDTLFRSVDVIDEYLEGLRLKTAPPDTGDILRDINSITVTPPENEMRASGPEPNTNDSGTDAGNPEERTWKFTFYPSKKLFDEGININVVRSRLSSLGKIISSVPLTSEDGQVSFEFLISSDKPEAEFAGMASEGITYEPYEDDIILPETSIKTDQQRIQKNVVRVDLAKLENIMRSVGDLVISRSRLDDILKRREDTHNEENVALQEINAFMERQIKALRIGIMDLRLVSIGEAFERLRYAVRDLVSKSNRRLKLLMEGRETHIDKFIMERMFDPLLHIVRNAISHGIETPDEREASGKSPEGTLLLKASASGNSVIFEISDDGRGVDRIMVKEKALKAGIITADIIPDNETLLKILSTSGFTTRESSDTISGRGIGMDVAVRTVEKLGGSIQLETEKGKGTRFFIQLPLTLSIVDALIVRSAGNTFAVPMPAVNEIIRFNTGDLVRYDNNEFIPYRDIVLPVIRLAEFFGHNQRRGGESDAIVTGSGRLMAGIMIDSITGQREIVVRSLADPLVNVDGISGATELGEGKIVLIIDIPAIVRASLGKRRSEKSTVI